MAAACLFPYELLPPVVHMLRFPYPAGRTGQYVPVLVGFRTACDVCPSWVVSASVVGGHVRWPDAHRGKLC